MTPERYRQIRELFAAALLQTQAQREDFLTQVCGEDRELLDKVRALLHEQEQEPATNFLDQTQGQDAPFSPAPQTQPQTQTWEGRRIGPYLIEQSLGQGGMGTVYLARRADESFEKKVALKLVRAELGSAEILQRFRQERQILASLEHPHIARLLDGGSTPEGLPYLVMEYVEGTPLDRYCDQHKLSLTRRLELFDQVCEAVQYAHQHSVVHRDLKPANILVTPEGLVKLLDFGIAKVLRATSIGVTLGETQAGQHLLTPEYASPEQLRGEPITAATDVYALGVVLYELLTGHRPYQMRSRLFHELVRVVCEEEPTRPSTAVTERSGGAWAEDGAADAPPTPARLSWLRESRPEELKRQLTGDLDNILLKALGKQPTSRYGSAEGLRQDLQRHRHGLPVEARPDSFSYRLGKLLRRHPALLGSLAAFALLSAGGAVTIHWPAVLIGTQFALCLAFGYYVRRLDDGKDFAEKMIPFHAAKVAICFAFVLLPFVWLPRPLFKTWVIVQMFMGLFLQAGALVWWIWRSRWAGSVLLDLSRAPGKGAQIVKRIMLILLAMMLITMWIDGQQVALRNILFLAFLVMFIVQNVSQSGRQELRQNGLVAAGTFFTWQQIEDYRWERVDDGLQVLKLRLRKSIWHTPPVRVPIAAERKAEVDAALARHVAGSETTVSL